MPVAAPTIIKGGTLDLINERLAADGLGLNFSHVGLVFCFVFNSEENKCTNTGDLLVINHAENDDHQILKCSTAKTWMTYFHVAKHLFIQSLVGIRNVIFTLPLKE